MFKRKAGATVALLVVAGLASCSSGTHHSDRSSSLALPSSPAAPVSDGQTIYMCAGGQSATLLQWTNSNGDLSGTYTESKVTGTAPAEQVSSQNGHLSGTLNGPDISLTLGLFSQPLMGTLNSGTLTLNLPQSDGSFQSANCASGTLGQWNSEVSGFDSQARSDNTTALRQQAQASAAAALAQAQQQLASDVSQLDQDASSLNTNKALATDVNQMQSDYQQEQADWATERSDYASGGCSSEAGDAGVVGGDVGVVSGDQGTLNSDIASIQNGISGIKQDMSTVQSDLAAVQGLGGSATVNVSATISTGNQAIKNANAAIVWANEHGNTIASEANQLATTAQNFETSHGC